MTPLQPCANPNLQCELKAYLDGQLPFVLRQRVRRHLRTCAACREELAAMEQISNQLHADGPQPLDSSLRDRILNAVTATGAEAPPIPSAAPPTSRWRRKPLLLWAGAATAFVAWFTLYPLVHGDLMRSLSGQQAQSNLHQLGASEMLYHQDYNEDSGTPTAAASPPVGMVSNAAPAAPIAAPPLPAPERRRSDAGRQFRANAPQHASPPAVALSDLNASISKPSGAKSAAAAAGETTPGAAKRVTDTLVLNGSQNARTPANMAANNGRSLTQMPVNVNNVRNLTQTQANLKAEEATEAAERQVHREASITLDVDNVETRSETVTQMAQTVGGYVGSNELSTGEDNVRTATLSLKVPVAQFDAVLAQVTRLGEVKAKNVTGEDVTEKISDQEQAERVMRQDIGSTQEELTHRLSKSAREERMDTMRELRTRIAQTRARLKLLRKLGALSTITLQLNEKPRPAPAPRTGGFLDEMNDTLHGAARSMLEAARLPILTFIWILAYSPLWILLLLGYRYAVRR